jgi:hypothetical protein
MKTLSLALTIVALVAVECHAQTPVNTSAKMKFDGKLICSAYSSSPEKQPALQLPLPIVFSDGLLTAERKLVENPGKETFHGLVGILSYEVMMIGEARLDSGLNVWVYEFHGKFNTGGTTTLNGTLRGTVAPIGTRSCTIEFG